jgi:hypothetical protein
MEGGRAQSGERGQVGETSVPYPPLLQSDVRY